MEESVGSPATARASLARFGARRRSLSFPTPTFAIQKHLPHLPILSGSGFSHSERGWLLRPRPLLSVRWGVCRAGAARGWRRQRVAPPPLPRAVAEPPLRAGLSPRQQRWHHNGTVGAWVADPRSGGSVAGLTQSRATEKPLVLLSPPADGGSVGGQGSQESLVGAAHPLPTSRLAGPASWGGRLPSHQQPSFGPPGSLSLQAGPRAISHARISGSFSDLRHRL